MSEKTPTGPKETFLARIEKTALADQSKTYFDELAALKPEEKSEFEKKLKELERDGKIEEMRKGDVSEKESRSNYYKRFAKLSAAFLEEKKDPDGRTVFHVDFKGNQIAENKVGAADMLPWAEIAVRHPDGSFECDRAVRAQNPKTGRIGFFDAAALAHGYYDYVPIHSGDDIIPTIIGVMPPKTGNIQSMREHVEIYQNGAMREGVFEPPENPTPQTPPADHKDSVPTPRTSPSASTFESVQNQEIFRSGNYNVILRHIEEQNPGFLQKVGEIAAKIGCDQRDLLWIMWKESKFNAQAVNFQKNDMADPCERSKKRATGLIQFMPSTAKWLGTDNQTIYNMSPLEQLKYVEKYFQKHYGKLHNYQDLYLVVFCPDGLGKNDDFILGSSQSMKFARRIAEQNWGMTHGKEVITVGDFRAYAGHPPANLGQI